MQLSGVLLVAQPGRLSEALQAVRQLSGIEVYDVDSKEERAIAVIEADNTNALVSSFKRLEKIESLLKASPLNHYFE